MATRSTARPTIDLKTTPLSDKWQLPSKQPQSKIENREPKSPRVVLSAGEASGDAYAGALVEQIRQCLPEATFAGIGGPKSRAAGVELLADSSQWGAISIVQSLRRVPRIIGTYFLIRAFVKTRPVGLFIPIDFGYLNIRLARRAKHLGWKVLYFVPPGSWRRDRQGKDLPSITDAVVTPFPWSAEILQGMGANAYWFGHPIKQILTVQSAQVDPDQPRKTLAVLPGSRTHEIDANLPLLAKVLEGWSDPVEFAIAPGLDLEQIQHHWVELTGREDTFASIGVATVLSRARAGLICSGTATLEAALCRCPMVVFYELTPTMRREVQLIRFKRPKFISLPNILLDREAVPEYAQAEPLDPARIRADLDAVWFDEQTRKRQFLAFDELDKMLGPSEAITRTADLACEMISRGT